jgi:hypothetical protein
MEPAIRNKLRNTVTQCRKLLEESIAQTLQGHFGIYHGNKSEVHVDDGSRMTHLSAEDQAYRGDILDSLEHIKALGRTPKDFDINRIMGEIVELVAGRDGGGHDTGRAKAATQVP